MSKKNDLIKFADYLVRYSLVYEGFDIEAEVDYYLNNPDEITLEE